MLDFERALAVAQGDVGVIPPDAARVIATACAELSLPPETLASEGKRSGSLAIPLVRALTEHVARVDAGAAAFVHYGSTSQDVLDTALVLCLKPCLADADRVPATAVRHGVAMRLHLHEARAWHDQRDELLRLMAELAIVVETIGKVARDVSLLSQAEVGEMLESAPVKGVGGSSAMPHKRNPVACLQALVAAARAPGLMATLLSGALGEHERALGGWQAELVTIPALADAAGGALDAL